MEQRPGNIGPPAAATAPTNFAPKSGAAKRAERKVKSAPPQRHTDPSSEVCYGWNKGSCNGPSCPDGRRHVCRLCQGSHKASECSKGRGKGGGKDGSKNVGGKKREAGKAGNSTYKK